MRLPGTTGIGRAVAPVRRVPSVARATKTAESRSSHPALCQFHVNFSSSHPHESGPSDSITVAPRLVHSKPAIPRQVAGGDEISTDILKSLGVATKDDAAYTDILETYRTILSAFGLGNIDNKARPPVLANEPLMGPWLGSSVIQDVVFVTINSMAVPHYPHDGAKRVGVSILDTRELLPLLNPHREASFDTPKLIETHVLSINGGGYCGTDIGIPREVPAREFQRQFSSRIRDRPWVLVHHGGIDKGLSLEISEILSTANMVVDTKALAVPYVQVANLEFEVVAYMMGLCDVSTADANAVLNWRKLHMGSPANKSRMTMRMLLKLLSHHITHTIQSRMSQFPIQAILGPAASPKSQDYARHQLISAVTDVSKTINEVQPILGLLNKVASVSLTTTESLTASQGASRIASDVPPAPSQSPPQSSPRPQPVLTYHTPKPFIVSTAAPVYPSPDPVKPEVSKQSGVSVSEKPTPVAPQDSEPPKSAPKQATPLPQVAPSPPPAPAVDTKKAPSPPTAPSAAKTTPSPTPPTPSAAKTTPSPPPAPNTAKATPPQDTKTADTDPKTSKPIPITLMSIVTEEDAEKRVANARKTLTDKQVLALKEMWVKQVRRKLSATAMVLSKAAKEFGGLERLLHAETVLAFSRVLRDVETQDTLTHLSRVWASVPAFMALGAKSLGFKGANKTTLMRIGNEPILNAHFSPTAVHILKEMLDARIDNDNYCLVKASAKGNTKALKAVLKTHSDTKSVIDKEPIKFWALLKIPDRFVMQFRVDTADKDNRPMWLSNVRDKFVEPEELTIKEAMAAYARADLQQSLSEVLRKVHDQFIPAAVQPEVKQLIQKGNELAKKLAEFELNKATFISKLSVKEYDQLKTKVQHLRLQHRPQGPWRDDDVQESRQEPEEEIEEDIEEEEESDFEEDDFADDGAKPSTPVSLPNGLLLPPRGSEAELTLTTTFDAILEKRATKAQESLENAKKASMLETARRHLAFIEKTDRDRQMLLDNPQNFLASISKFDVMRLMEEVEARKAADAKEKEISKKEEAKGKEEASAKEESKAEDKKASDAVDVPVSKSVDNVSFTITKPEKNVQNGGELGPLCIMPFSNVKDVLTESVEAKATESAEESVGQDAVSATEGEVESDAQSAETKPEANEAEAPEAAQQVEGESGEQSSVEKMEQDAVSEQQQIGAEEAPQSEAVSTEVEGREKPIEVEEASKEEAVEEQIKEEAVEEQIKEEAVEEQIKEAVEEQIKEAVEEQTKEETVEEQTKEEAVEEQLKEEATEEQSKEEAPKEQSQEVIPEGQSKEETPEEQPQEEAKPAEEPEPSHKKSWFGWF